MRNWHWIIIGAGVGLASGAVFGLDYALAGIGIGVAGGLAVALGLRTR